MRHGRQVFEAVLRDEHRVLPTSAPLRGFADFDTDVCLSVPRIVSRAGVSPPLPTPIDESERDALERSVDAVSAVLTSLG
jgi:L-lactate dehydrogenase